MYFLKVFQEVYSIFVNSRSIFCQILQSMQVIVGIYSRYQYIILYQLYYNIRSENAKLKLTGCNKIHQSSQQDFPNKYYKKLACWKVVKLKALTQDKHNCRSRTNEARQPKWKQNKLYRTLSAVQRAVAISTLYSFNSPLLYEFRVTKCSVARLHDLPSILYYYQASHVHPK